MNNILEINDLKASVISVDKQIIKGLNLSINEGETHVIMGPNGSGKSTLSNVLMGHPAYRVDGGAASFLGEDLFKMPTDERARKGMFLSFQYPEEVSGVKNEYFLRMAVGSKTGSKPNTFKFRKELLEMMKDLNLNESYLDRHLNVGFSGGEKKKNEILQMRVLNPKLSILDETDSGLDVDAIRVVYETIEKFKSEKNAFLVITHYSRILKYIKPDFIHLFVNGRIVRSGGIELAELVDREGYKNIEEF